MTQVREENGALSFSLEEKESSLLQENVAYDVKTVRVSQSFLAALPDLDFAFAGTKVNLLLILNSISLPANRILGSPGVTLDFSPSVLPFTY